jgi:protein ImuB
VFAVIYIPNFSLQSVLRHEPELISKPVVLTDPALTKPCVTQLTSAARACGICAGMSPSQAMARCGNLVVKTRSLPQEQTAMETLMQTAYAFSPHIEATAPGVCTIELKGLPIQTNETSAKQWAAEILRVLKQFHLDGQIGFAETPALALLAAHAAKPVLITQRAFHPLSSSGRTSLVGGEGRGEEAHFATGMIKTEMLPTAQDEPNFISTLPIEALDLPFESLEILKRWGINTAGAFLALGKDQLAERLGPAIVEVFDRLSTQSVRPLKIAAPPEIFAEEIEFENEIETLEPLLFILRRFVEQLSRRIELLYLVVAELHLKLGLTSGATYERTFTIPSPTGNAETLFRVLHTHLETVRTDAPIATLRLTAKPGRPESHQFGLFETTLRNPNQFAETLARLTALCDSDRVGTPVVEATYRPDTFQMKAADFRTSFERTFRTRTKTPSPCSSRRKETLTALGSAQQRNMEPPYVDGYSLAERAPSPWGEGDSDLRRPKPQPRRDTRFCQPTVCRKQFPSGLPLRRFRPSLPARIETREHRPVLMRSAVFNGVIVDVRGPFLSSGNWWENNRWWREEWDIQTSDGNLYRIFRAAEEVGETVGRDCAVRVAPARTALAPPTTLDSNERASSPQSGTGLPPHSPADAGNRERDERQKIRQLLECGSQMVPPLPKGEGWGEGEGIGRYPKVSEPANCVQPPTAHGEGEERVPLHRPGFEFFVEGVYD